MASKPQVSARRYYEDFEPTFEWVRDAASHTLAVKLPGFRKEELKIQIDNFGRLRATGERALSANKWSRFRKDFQIPADSKFDNIKAKFVGDTLYIEMPKNVEPPIQQKQPPPPQQQPTTTTTIIAPPQSVSDDKNGRKTAPTTTKQTPVQPVSADRKTAPVASTEKPRIQQNQPPLPPSQHTTTATTTKLTPVQPVSTDRKTTPAAGTEKPTVLVSDKEKEKNSGLSSVSAKITNEVPQKESGMSSAFGEVGKMAQPEKKEKSGGFEVAEKVTQGTMKEEMGDAGKSTTSPENQPSMMGRLVLGLKERRSFALKVGAGVMVVVALGIYVNSMLKAMEDFED